MFESQSPASIPDYSLPKAGEVVVWRLSLTLPADAWERCEEVLSPHERERGKQLIRAEHRQRHVATHGQLRWLLAGYLDCHPCSIEFRRGRWGKPYLPGLDLKFNLSHSQECLLVAVGRKYEMGVDVEAVHPPRSMEGMARRCFSQGEWSFWCSLDQELQLEVFFRLWTLKEAMVKASGCGLGLGVRRCVFSLDPLQIQSLPEECGSVAEWQARELGIIPGFKASLCVHGELVKVVQRSLAVDWISGVR